MNFISAIEEVFWKRLARALSPAETPEPAEKQKLLDKEEVAWAATKVIYKLGRPPSPEERRLLRIINPEHLQAPEARSLFLSYLRQYVKQNHIREFAFYSQRGNLFLVVRYYPHKTRAVSYKPRRRPTNTGRS